MEEMYYEQLHLWYVQCIYSRIQVSSTAEMLEIENWGSNDMQRELFNYQIIYVAII